jgi:hypothetical protein
MRTIWSTAVTHTLPSPMVPVLAAAVMISTTLSVSPPSSTTSTFTFGRRSTMYSEPR